MHLEIDIYQIRLIYLDRFQDHFKIEYYLIFRKAKKVTRKPTKASAAAEATTPELEGLSFISTGPGYGTGSGVYYIDFSDEYKGCLRRARDELEKETHLSFLEKKEAKWADEISQDRNLPIEDRLLQLKVQFSRRKSLGLKQYNV